MLRLYGHRALLRTPRRLLSFTSCHKVDKTEKKKQEVTPLDVLKEKERLGEWMDPEQRLPGEYKNWRSMGWDKYDPENDEYQRKFSYFIWFSVMTIWGPFFFLYGTDWNKREWTNREAYLELARREKHGLPLVDPEYVPIENILATLPSDEELGDFEIII